MKPFRITLMVFAASAMMLSLTQCNTNVPQSVAEAKGGDSCCQTLRIAYVNIDTLLTSYDFWVSLNEDMINKRENITAQINKEANALQKEMEQFQSKVDNNAFVSRERAESEYNRIMKKQQDLQAKQERLSNEFAAESAKNDQIIRDSINSFLKVYNADHRYTLILSRIGDNILYADDAMNITQEVVDGLNARYAK
ncbi:MAG: OmpH family outer membrane protein [Bacteroidaceae bacterium]|nr:OmpH family outer membrane protein [Bacteroidaceae bacterium]